MFLFDFPGRVRIEMMMARVNEKFLRAYTVLIASYDDPLKKLAEDVDVVIMVGR